MRAPLAGAKGLVCVLCVYVCVVCVCVMCVCVVCVVCVEEEEEEAEPVNSCNVHPPNHCAKPMSKHVSSSCHGTNLGEFVDDSNW